MNDYKRLVSYIYAYPGNVKDKNTGFAKAEVRNGQFKLDITLHSVHSDVPEVFGVYLMIRNGIAFNTIKLDNIIINAGCGKYRDIINPSNIAFTGYTFSDICGIAIANADNDYYRMYSLWDDNEFIPSNVSFSPVNEKASSTAENYSDNRIYKEGEAQSGSSTSGNISDNSSSDNNISNDSTSNDTITNNITSGNNISDDSDSNDNTLINHFSDGITSNDNTSINSVSGGNSLNINALKNSSSSDSNSNDNASINSISGDNSSDISTSGNNIYSKNNSNDNISINSVSGDNSSNVNASCNDISIKRNSDSKTSDNTSNNMSENTIHINSSDKTAFSPSGAAPAEIYATSADNNCAVSSCQPKKALNNEAAYNRGFEKFFKNADFIDAFDNDYYYDCIEISPEQLKAMPLYDETIARNSFLIHGYYNYRHLLFGHVQENDNGTHYFIGVPGMYCNRERFMASMYGFGNFKKSHRSDYTNPYFGYWYQEI